MKEVLLFVVGIFLIIFLFGSVSAAIVFEDDFEYDVDRNLPGARQTFVANGPWTWVKTYQDGETGARGYIYTTTSIPGYTGLFPGANSNNVVAIEFLPDSMGGQTDVYLSIGDANSPSDNIPSDVWIQYWVYMNRYGSQISVFDDGKLLYPSITGTYPSSWGTGLDWLVDFKTYSYYPFLENADLGNTYYEVECMGCDNQAAPDWDQWKTGHNINPFGGLLEANQWILVKLHFDTSGNSPLAPLGQGLYEMWLKNVDGDFEKVAEWIGGVTTDFVWPISNPDGHRALRLGTTVNNYDSWMYMDDFAMADSEADLPVYGSVQPQCSNSLDDDGDGQIDLADVGCTDANDDDESNCGDLVCEGGETCSSCVSDCPTGIGEVCCSSVIYTGDCCLDTDCVSPDTCNLVTHLCTLLSGTIVSVDSTYGGYSMDVIDDEVIDAYNGTLTTWASGVSTTQPHWVVINFAQPRDINNVDVYWAYNNQQGMFMSSQEVQVQYWDGSQYLTAATITNTGAVEVSSAIFPTVSTTSLRFWQPINMGPPTYSNIFWLTEIDYFSGTSACGSADTDTSGDINIGEIINYITRYKNGEIDIGEMITGITEYRYGC